MRNSDSSRPRALLLVGLLVVAGSLCFSFVGSTADTRVMAAPPDAAAATLYDPDPKHLWNRLHCALHIPTVVDGDQDPPQYARQTIDPNDLDPFFWYPHHPYLLSGSAYREALALLDEFLDKQGEGLVKDSLKRALLQRDLWTLFDWAADPGWSNLGEKDRFVNERRELQTRLGRVIPRLALSAREIEQLPDNYAAAVKARRYPTEFDADRKTAAFLPADLWDPKGPWVLLGTSAGGHLAGDHVSFFGGRSTFLIFLRLPEGRDQTLKYLEQLSDWQRKRPKGDIPRDIPQFPANTQVALARRTVLLDDRGEIRPTPLTEQVQLRILHDPTSKDGVQTFLQFRLRREQLLEGQAGELSAVPDDEGEWDYLFNLGRTVIDRGFIRPIMASCGGCHGNAPGVRTMNSFARGSLRNEWDVTSLGDEERRIGAWKREQSSWKLLKEFR
ncbi:MAG: hypothetical protein HY290_31560 [Planctomycetia bacterium]|nr:hypothetical protein [Planctomycetia bacterium]